MRRTHVIHLESSSARAPLIAALDAGLPGVQIVPAVDGRALSPQEIAAVTGEALATPHYPFGLLPSEIGCFLSHRRAWQQIVDSGEAAGWVAEDDLALQPGFAAARALAEAHITPDRLIRFPMAQREQPDQVLDEADGVTLFRPRVIGLTATLYLLGRDAAARLLAASERFDRPVDTWLQMRWDTGVNSLTLWPAGIESAATSHGGSTIQRKKSMGAEISRSWHRTRYRTAISRMSASR